MTRREEFEAKLSRVRRWLGERGHGAALLTTHGGFSRATAGGEGWVALADDLAVGELGLDAHARPWHTTTGLGEIARELAGLVYDRGLCALRYTLLAPEVERYRQLARDATQVVEGGCRTLSPDVTEHEIAASIAGTKSEDTVLVTDGGVEILSWSGAWPAVEVQVAGQVIRRPDILER